MALTFSEIISVLSLSSNAPDSWQGNNLELDYHRVFGGQILGQTLRTAALALPDKEVRSFTQLFPREGAAATPITYTVSRHQEGKTFGTSGVVASQDGKVISVASVSSHRPDPEVADAPAQQATRPAGSPKDAVPQDIPMVPWEIRVIDGVDLGDRAVGPASFGFWMKTPAVADDPSLHQALLAYATDLTLIGTALRPIPELSQADTMVRFHSAVTAHSLTFHRPVKVDEWLLIDQVSPVLAAGRSYGRGDVWTEDGTLVASFTQESMVRML